MVLKCNSVTFTPWCRPQYHLFSVYQSRQKCISKSWRSLLHLVWDDVFSPHERIWVKCFRNMVNQSLMEKISSQENFSIKLNALPQTIQDIDNIWCWRFFVIRNLTLCSHNWGIWPIPLLVFWIEYAPFWNISCPCMSVRIYWWFMIQFFQMRAWDHCQEKTISASVFVLCLWGQVLSYLWPTVIYAMRTRLYEKFTQWAS